MWVGLFGPALTLRASCYVVDDMDSRVIKFRTSKETHKAYSRQNYGSVKV
jgi:hypothetical protein